MFFKSDFTWFVILKLVGVFNICPGQAQLSHYLDTIFNKAKTGFGVREQEVEAHFGF